MDPEEMERKIFKGKAILGGMAIVLCYLVILSFWFLL